MESEEKGAGLELSLEEMGGDAEPGQTAGGGEGRGGLRVGQAPAMLLSGRSRRECRTHPSLAMAMGP